MESLQDFDIYENTQVEFAASDLFSRMTSFAEKGCYKLKHTIKVT